MAELISVTLTDGKKTEIVNLDHITRIQPMGDGTSVIVMADGSSPGEIALTNRLRGAP
jgi:hypothetical protein